MSITLYDLCASDENKRFSPACWRTKMSLVHKGLDFDTVPTPFTKIREIEGGVTKTVPLIVDGQEKVSDSFEIALYLDRQYPDAPTLMGGEDGIALARFVKAWANTMLHPIIAGLIVKDIHDILAAPDQDYFRKSREAMFKKTLEEFQTDREAKVAAFRQALTPLRVMLKEQPFIGGKSVLFADYIVFGSLKWVLSIADFELLAADDTVLDWYKKIDAMHNGK